MQSVDWIGPDVWFAHSVHVNQAEIELYARTGCGVAHCPTSNMRLASGIAPVREYMQAGVKVGLGVDGSASNDGSHLLAEARQAMLLARLRAGLEGASLSGEGCPAAADRPPGAGTGHPRRRSGFGPQRYWLAGSRQMRRFYRHRSQPAGIRRRAARPGGGSCFLRPAGSGLNVVGGQVIVQDGQLLTVDVPQPGRTPQPGAQRLLNG